MGPEKLDNTVYTMRGLRDLADMAHSKGDQPTFDWATAKAQDLESRFESSWWMPEIPQHADSLDEANEKIQQRHWIGVTPMEAELVRDQRAVPGITTFENGTQALELRERDCYGDAFGLYRCAGGATPPSRPGRPSGRRSR